MQRVVLWMTLTTAVLGSRPGASFGIEAAQGSVGAGTGVRIASGSTSPSYEEVKGWIEAYKAAHPGNRGKDSDLNAKSPAQIAADPAAQQLLAICGKDQRPVIPLLAWEYGGSDHPWRQPQVSALVYCVYTPVETPSPNWRYVAANDHIIADVSIKFPDHNPCKSQSGANQVAACIGDQSNFEILVDTASLNDGRDVGLMLSEASTELKLILSDGTRVHLRDDK